MKIKPNIETLIYVLVILLSLLVVFLVAAAPGAFRDTKIVYQGF